MNTNTALLLDLTTKIAAVTPIVGASADFTKDKSTWTIFPIGGGEVLISSIPAAAAVVQAFDPTAPIVPFEVSPIQARLALTAAGKRDQVEAAVNAASTEVQDYWHYAGEIQRNHPVILQMAQVLGWTSADLDALFIAAAAIT